MKCQLDVIEGSLLQNLLFAQHVSGTIMLIIRSSTVLYRWMLLVVFGALVFKLSVRRGAVGCVSSLRDTTAPRQTDNLKTKAPSITSSNHLYNTVHLLMMGIMVPETCWANNKFCSKEPSVASSWHFISTYYPRRLPEWLIKTVKIG